VCVMPATVSDRLVVPDVPVVVVVPAEPVPVPEVPVVPSLV
jgi:hypothetical protein